MKMEVASGEEPSTACELCATRERCLFYSLPIPSSNLLKSKVTERTVDVGETIEVQGNRVTKIGVIKMGLMKGMRTNRQNGSNAIVLLGRGRLIGLPGAFHLPSQLTFVATLPSRLCELDLTLLNEYAARHSAVQDSLLHHAGIRMGCIMEWSSVLREESHLERLCNALQLIAIEEGNSAFRIPSHADLANLLGSRRETIARSMATLIRRGRFRKVGRWHGFLTSERCDD
ncbi:MAG: Crp/Fnr family transcriptional regulator [Burkholderiaceae bacterium]